jgi:hypothetical protein
MADITPAGGVTILPPEDEALPVLDAAGAPAAAEDVPVLLPDGAPALPRGAVLNADRTVTYTLIEPVTLRYRTSPGAPPTEELRTSFTFRRLRGADMRSVAEAAEGDRALTLLALATGTPLARMTLIYDRMDAEDATAMGEIAGFLLGTGRKTGR